MAGSIVQSGPASSGGSQTAIYAGTQFPTLASELDAATQGSRASTQKKSQNVSSKGSSGSGSFGKGRLSSDSAFTK